MTNPKPESKRRGWRSHVLIIVQNLPIEVDRRVLLELHELLDRGYQVSLICPKGLAGCG